MAGLGWARDTVQPRADSKAGVMPVLLPLLMQTMTDVVGNPEEERRAEFYFQPWAQEAVCRYFYSKVGAVPEHKGNDTSRASDARCRLAMSQAVVPVLSSGAAEAARIRASPRNPKYIGLLWP